MKLYSTTLSIVILLFSFITLSAQPIPPNSCGIESIGNATQFNLHPEMLPEYNQRGANSTWSVTSPYGGCMPNDCAANGGFDCCINMPCEDYQIPVVFTLLRDNACGSNSMTVAEIDIFIGKMNSYYDCAGIPFNLFKCTFADDSGVDYEGNTTTTLDDGSTRTICNSDYNEFFVNGGSDQAPDDPNGNGIGDFGEVNDFNIPNVMNIYIPGDFNGFTGMGFLYEGGVARYPSNNLNSYGTVFGIDGLNNTMSDCDANPNGGDVAIHELGHWFGLVHTHGDVNSVQVNAGDPNGNFWAECPDGSECCTSGDFICDTDPDPNMSPNVSDSAGGAIVNCIVEGPNCTFDLSGCFSTCATPYSNTTNAINNIMSYSRNGCAKFELTDCQKAKMVDGLLCGRSNLVCCDPIFTDTDQAAPYVAEEIIIICVGDPIPTFTINDATGGSAANPDLNTTCIGWYRTAVNTVDFDDLSTGLTFTPDADDIDNGAPGTYTFYFDDDLNNYSTTPCDDDIRKEVTLIITEQAEAITNNDGCIEGTQSLDFSYSSNLSDNCQILGYYFSDSDPSALSPTTTINNATNGSAPLNLTTGNIIQANTGTPMTDLNALSIDCDALGGDGSYFLTPFITQCEEDFMCSGSGAGTAIIWNFNPQLGGAVGSPTQYSGCTPPAGYQLESCTVTVTVTQYSGNTSGTIGFDVRDGSSCNSISGAPDFSQNVASVPFTFTIPKAALDAAMGDSDFEETTDAFCLQAVDFGGDNTVQIAYTIDLAANYTGRDAQTLWDANSAPTIVDSDCFWGPPLEIICTDLDISAAVATDCNDNSGTIDITITGGTPNYTVSGIGLSGIDLTGSTTLTGATGPGTITITDDIGCVSTTTIIVDAACALPVDLLAFTGEHRDGFNYLTWQTASELENDHFLVERSSDGLKFEPLGKVQGAGTTVESQRYEFLDVTPKTGINYYRLQQVDFGGTFDYSEIITIATGKEQLVAEVYPSPTSSLLNIIINQEINAIEIIDLTGRTVLAKSYDYVNTTQLNVADLPIGTYFLSIKSDDAIELVRFVKN